MLYWLKTSDGEVALATLPEAVKAERAKIVSILVGRSVRTPVSRELLLYAVREAGCNRDLVTPLVLAQTAEFIDIELQQWAERAIREGDDNGQWLLDLFSDHIDKLADARADA
jgi:hypothetical protein